MQIRTYHPESHHRTSEPWIGCSCPSGIILEGRKRLQALPSEYFQWGLPRWRPKSLLASSVMSSLFPNYWRGDAILELWPLTLENRLLWMVEGLEGGLEVSNLFQNPLKARHGTSFYFPLLWSMIQELDEFSCTKMWSQKLPSGSNLSHFQVVIHDSDYLLALIKQIHQKLWDLDQGFLRQKSLILCTPQFKFGRRSRFHTVNKGHS